ncbi:MAG: heparinase II/III family protein [Clostridia bacterium]|nr:heparinase II/III family protein [Clostridia bacterium]
MLISPYLMPEILPPQEHPRVMLRKKDLERIRENLEGKSFSVTADLFWDLCDFPVRCQGATPKDGTYHLKEYLAVEAKALRALLYDEAGEGRDAVEALLFLLRNSHFDGGIMTARYSGHLIFLAAEVYDWCYRRITEDERKEIIATCEGFAERYFEMGYPPEKQSAISGHGNEAQLLRDLLAFSIAVYDERPDIYHFCGGRLFSEYLPAYEQVFAGGFHPQGPCYGAYRYSFALWFGLLIFAMSGEKVLPTPLETFSDSLLYLTRWDGEALRLGDDYNEKKALYTKKNPFFVPLFLSAAYTGQSRYVDAAQRQFCKEYLVPMHFGSDYYKEGAYGEGMISPSVYLIWDRLQPLTQSSSLPKGRFFGWPVGCTLYNDGERLILMKIGNLWGANHDHLDTGCFQIYDKEILASDSGVYDSYGTDHRKRYLIQTLAHNCLLVDGKGTRFPQEKREPKTLDCWLSEYGMAKVTYHREDSGRYEIEGNLSEAYSETCSLVTRRMCWEPDRGERGLLTVRDTVFPKDSNAPVTFLLHCQDKPRCCEGEILIEGKCRGLRCRIKTPSDPKITFVGGEGHRFESEGVNYEPRVHSSEEGWGRVEITTQGEEVRFCVEMEIVKKEKSV